jgi:hypothetical protein
MSKKDIREICSLLLDQALFFVFGQVIGRCLRNFFEFLRLLCPFPDEILLEFVFVAHILPDIIDELDVALSDDKIEVILIYEGVHPTFIFLDFIVNINCLLVRSWNFELLIKTHALQA